jgi:hypothetical protein
MAAGLLAAPAMAVNTDPNEVLRPAESLEGNFLAAYVAGSARDTKAATVFFRQAIQEDPRNLELLERPSWPFWPMARCRRPFGRRSV